MSSAVRRPAMCKSSLLLRSSSLLGSILIFEVVFLPSKIVFHQMLSFIKGCPPLKVIFHRRSSSIEGRLPLKVVFHQRLSTIEGRLPSQVFFHQKSSSYKFLSDQSEDRIHPGDTTTHHTDRVKC